MTLLIKNLQCCNVSIIKSINNIKTKSFQVLRLFTTVGIMHIQTSITIVVEISSW
jgi:hypothetical protein